MELLFNFLHDNECEYNINTDLYISKHSHPQLGVISINNLDNITIYNDTLNEFVPCYSLSNFIIGWNNNYTITYNNTIIKIINKQLYKML
jgi:hypothetical protein